jgi:hypothetical protein
MNADYNMFSDNDGKRGNKMQELNVLGLVEQNQIPKPWKRVRKHQKRLTQFEGRRQQSKKVEHDYFFFFLFVVVVVFVFVFTCDIRVLH